ncbi:hypothetical protein [Lacrimispora sp.]|nr:hypothetical protein [Lacrimispora sp.]
MFEPSYTHSHSRDKINSVRVWDFILKRSLERLDLGFSISLAI